MNKIEIYTNETCPYCKSIKEELTKADIEFENKFTNENEEEWQKIVNLTGMPTVPTIKYGDDFLVPQRDFGNPQNLINILNNESGSEYSYSRRTFEKMKTLNSNINMAFNRLDQLLRKIETKLNTEENDG
jgi:glutaredoxin